MKFRSPTETPIHIGLLSGHTCLIGPELVEVPQMFHRQAVAKGALPEGVEPDPVAGKSDTKHDLILKGIRAMVKDENDGDFNQDGKPDTRKLSARVGFTVSSDERNTAWEEIANDD